MYTYIYTSLSLWLWLVGSELLPATRLSYSSHWQAADWYRRNVIWCRVNDVNRQRHRQSLHSAVVVAENNHQSKFEKCGIALCIRQGGSSSLQRHVFAGVWPSPESSFPTPGRHGPHLTRVTAKLHLNLVNYKFIKLQPFIRFVDVSATTAASSEWLSTTRCRHGRQ